MRLRDALRFLLSRKYRMWHVSQYVKHAQWQRTQPQTEEEMIADIATRQVKAIRPINALQRGIDAHGNLCLDDVEATLHTGSTASHNTTKGIPIIVLEKYSGELSDE